MSLVEEDLIKLSFLYMEYNNTFNIEYQKYSHFKNMISYITGIENQKLIRYIFQKLINKKVFKKIKIGKITNYHFNPYNKPLPPKDTTVYFD